MTDRFDFFGFQGSAEPDDAPGSIGVRINGVKMLHRVFAVGQRLAAAGAQGISVDDVNRSDIAILRDAGHSIDTDDIGARWYLRGKLREPNRYLVPDPAPNPGPARGQFNASPETRTY